MVHAFERFPGVGRRTAERLAFHVLQDEEARELAPAIQYALAHTKTCATCCNVADTNPCAVCSDEKRDARTICVVERPRDVEALERAAIFRGRYHVLMGAFNPAEGVDPRHLTVDRLRARVAANGADEVILATDPDAEGEATAQLVLEALESLGAKAPRVSRLARGVPSGSAIEYLHRGVLEDALQGRREVKLRTRPG
ncbi:MAG: recombination mediator RecR [Planctomycetes bacterium]|nr:recombination mediator RecR [Planctomycetota bacterium]